MLSDTSHDIHVPHPVCIAIGSNKVTANNSTFNNANKQEMFMLNEHIKTLK